MNKGTKYVDLTYLMGMSEGNDELIREMIGIFKAQVPEFISEMTTYLENKEYQSLGAIAHKAKSSVYIMGMNDLADDLKDLEKKAKNQKDPDSYSAHINRFIETCELAINELESLYSK